MNSTSMDQVWHSSAELQEKLQDFYRSKCEPDHFNKIKKERHHRRFMAYLKDELKTAVDFKATGSTAEGIKVPTSEMEFDVMVIFSADEKFILEEIPGNPLYAKIKDFGLWSQRYISPDSKVYSLYSTFDKLLQSRSCRSQGFYAKLRRHGPAVQLDVYEDEGRQNLLYLVDMVPSYRFKKYNGYAYYVPKSVSSCESQDGIDSWRRSFSLEEVALLKVLDFDGGCRKHCIMILKALMKDTEAGLRRLNSYVIKTAMLSLLRDDRDSNLDWSLENLGERFMDFLKYIALALGHRYLSHYFVDTFNLLQPPHDMVYTNMHYRLKELIRSKKKFYELMPRVYRWGQESSWAYLRTEGLKNYSEQFHSSHMSRYDEPNRHGILFHSPDESTFWSSLGSMCWKLISCCATGLFHIIKVCLLMVVFTIFAELLVHSINKR